MYHSQFEVELRGPFEDKDDGESGSSSSSTSDSVSSYSSDSSLGTTDKRQLFDELELTKIIDEVLSLPRGLCENESIFREFFSLKTWQLLPQQLRVHLQQFLPKFDTLMEQDAAVIEQQRTLSLLFNGELRRFGKAPLEVLQENLEAGNCRPDVHQLRQSIAKSCRRERRFRNCERLSQMAKEMFVSREHLLRAAYKLAPEAAVRSHRSFHRRQSRLLNTDTKLCAVRARKRYYFEIRDLAQKLEMQSSELSANEDDDADAPTAEELRYDALQLSNADQNVAGCKNDLFTTSTTHNSNLDKHIYSTHFKRRDDQMDDETALRATQHSKQPRLCNRNFRQHLLQHKRRKLTEPTLPDFETSDIRLRDVCARAQLGGNFKRFFAVAKAPGRKPKSKVNKGNGPPALVPIQRNIGLMTTTVQSSIVDINEVQIKSTRINLSQTQLPLGNQNKSESQQTFREKGNESFQFADNNEVALHQENISTFGTNTCEETLPAFVIANEIVVPSAATTVAAKSQHRHQQQPKQTTSAIETHQHIEIPKLEPFIKNIKSCDKILVDGGQQIQLQNIVSVFNSNPDTSPWSVASTELIQETHACFFSLIRDFFCATPHHRMQFEELKKKIDVWLHNPITALNDWYGQAENWSMLLLSGINFLAGNCVELPEEYVPYIDHKTQLNIYQWIGAGRDSDARLNALCNYWLQRKSDLIINQSTIIAANEQQQQLDSSAAVLLRRRSDVDVEDIDTGISGISPPPPPSPRCPTNWTVRAATFQEMAEFQRQERERFEQPHKAYTYRMYGYESVVGPVKGIYSQIVALTKARGHSMMVGDRPNFVTILTLVRDATARLPNGEGTRADISELLKCSQYISQDAAENVLQTIVSGALDRMHTEYDPCVRYDPKRKIWIYLHRNRNEAEFERVHQHQQTLSKQQKKPPQRKSKSKCGGMGETVETTAITSLQTVPTSTITVAPSLPALVPSNPIIVNSKAVAGSGQNHQQQQQQLQQVLSVQQPTLSKYPPVPPLKYNIPTQSQQQKSLLKHTVNPGHKTALSPIISSASTDMASPLRNTPQMSTPPAAPQLKQFSFSVPHVKSSGAIANVTPIIVATPQGLQTVHVSHAIPTTTTASSGTSHSNKTIVTNAAMQLQTQTISATLGGKKVALNKPIIINQITSNQQQQQQHQHQSATKLIKSPQSIGNWQTPSQKQNLIPPFNNDRHQRNTRSVSTTTDSCGMKQTKDVTVRNLPANILVTNTTAQVHGDANTSQAQSVGGITTSPQQQTKNIIRLMPAGIVSTKNNNNMTNNALTGTNAVTSVGISKTVLPPSGKQTVQIIGQRVIANTTVRSHPQHQQKNISGVSIVNKTYNNSPGTMAKQLNLDESAKTIGTTATALPMNTPTGTIFKMSAQAFASLQQKHSASGQHIIVKQATSEVPVQQQQPQLPQRLVVGNTAIISQPMQSVYKNFEIQTKSIIPNDVSLNQKLAITTTACKAEAVNSGVQSTATVISNVNKVQNEYINASSLMGQQRVLLQSSKQQQQPQIQFKAVQVMANTTQQQQQLQKIQSQLEKSSIVGKSHIVNIVPQQRPVTASSTVVQAAKQPTKTVAVVVSQPQGMTRIVKSSGNTEHAQLQQFTTLAANEPSSTGTRVVTSSTGQIISLETLLQKQGNALRVTSNSDPKGIAHSSNLIPLTANNGHLVNSAQYSVVSPSRNVISIGKLNRLSTTGTTGVAESISATVHQAKDPNGVVVSSAVSSNVSAGTRIIVPQVTAVNATKLLGKSNIIGGTTGGSTNVSSTSGNIRLINAAGGATNLNVSNIQGKQVLFSAKPGAGAGANVKNVITVLPTSNQAQQLQNTGLMIGTPAMRLQQTKGQQIPKTGHIISLPQPNSSPMQTVIMGNQILRVQQLPSQLSKTMQHARVNVTSATTAASLATASIVTSKETGNVSKSTMVSTTGQTIRLQSIAGHNQLNTSQTNAANVKTTPTSRVVLAVQGGSPIFLSPSFQSGSVNLKSIQNMRVVPLTQAQPVKKDVKVQQPEETSFNNAQKILPQQSVLKGTSTGIRTGNGSVG